MNLSVVIHTCNLGTYETKTGGLPQVYSCADLHSEFRAARAIQQVYC